MGNSYIVNQYYMTKLHFSHLTIKVQLDLLYREGVFLSKRKLGRISVVLYQYESVYVEIYYLRYREKIGHITYSEEPGILEPYLEEMNVVGFLTGIE
jgi:hypothetical protein